MPGQGPRPSDLRAGVPHDQIRVREILMCIRVSLDLGERPNDVGNSVGGLVCAKGENETSMRRDAKQECIEPWSMQCEGVEVDTPRAGRCLPKSPRRPIARSFGWPRC